MYTVVKNVIVVALTIIILFNCGKQEEIIAEVGSLVITKSEFLEEAQKKNVHESKDSTDKKISALNRLILRKLKLNDALSKNLKERNEFRLSIDKFKQNLLGRMYYEKFFLHPLVTQKDIDEYIERQGYEMKVTHILIRHNKGKSGGQRNTQEARNLALDAYVEEKNGADFTELVKKYSEDPSAKQNNGDLGYLRWGGMAEPFQQAAWNLKVGEISGPVETEFGIHIIRLDDKRKIANYTPDTTAVNISKVKDRLYQLFSDTAYKNWKAHVDTLKEKSDINIDNESITKLSEIVSEKIKKNQIKLDDFSEDEKNLILASWNGGDITFYMLIQQYYDRFNQLLMSLRDKNIIKKSIDHSLERELIVHEAEGKQLHRDSEFVKKVKEFEESGLIAMIEKNVTEGEVKILEGQLEQYYKDNINKFKIPEKIEIWEIYLDNEKLAKELSKKINQGASFEKIAGKYSKDDYYKTKGGYLGYRAVGMRSEVSKKAFEIGPGGKIAGPFKFRKGWAIIKTGKKQNEIIQPFKEVKTKILTFLRQNQIREKKQILENELKNKYPVHIDEKKLAEIDV